MWIVIFPLFRPLTVYRVPVKLTTFRLHLRHLKICSSSLFLCEILKVKTFFLVTPEHLRCTQSWVATNPLYFCNFFSPSSLFNWCWNYGLVIATNNKHKYSYFSDKYHIDLLSFYMNMPLCMFLQIISLTNSMYKGC